MNRRSFLKVLGVAGAAPSALMHGAGSSGIADPWTAAQVEADGWVLNISEAKFFGFRLDEVDRDQEYRAAMT